MLVYGSKTAWDVSCDQAFAIDAIADAMIVDGAKRVIVSDKAFSDRLASRRIRPGDHDDSGVL